MNRIIGYIKYIADNKFVAFIIFAIYVILFNLFAFFNQVLLFGGDEMTVDIIEYVYPLAESSYPRFAALLVSSGSPKLILYLLNISVPFLLVLVATFISVKICDSYDIKKQKFGILSLFFIIGIYAYLFFVLNFYNVMYDISDNFGIGFFKSGIIYFFPLTIGTSVLSIIFSLCDTKFGRAVTVIILIGIFDTIRYIISPFVEGTTGGSHILNIIGMIVIGALYFIVALIALIPSALLLMILYTSTVESILEYFD